MEINNNLYCHLVDMTYQEKFDLFMKSKKKELVEMLIESSRIIDTFTEKPKLYTTLKNSASSITTDIISSEKDVCINKLKDRIKHLKNRTLWQRILNK